MNKLKQKLELRPKVIKQQKIIECPIYIFDLNDDIDSNEIVEICHLYQTEDHKEKSIQSVYAWRSEYHKVSNNNMPKFQKLIDVVSNKIKLIWKLPYTYSVDHFWFAIYNNGDSAHEHDHGVADLACVYYASIPENSAPLILPTIDGDHKIQPKNGMLVVFPGLCNHKVPKSEHTGERIMVAMNIMKGNILDYDWDY